MKLFRLFFLFSFITLFSATAHADTPPPPPGNNQPPPGGETVEAKLAAALRRTEELAAELEKLKKPGDKKDGDGDDTDLRKKVAKDKETADEINKQTKEIERALSFNMRVTQFVKDNKDLLPSEIEAIVAQAEKETYDTAAHKAAVVKKAIIESYFAVASNLEQITASQKIQLDDYLKLTKTGKEQKAAEIYENIFEPALETVRRVKKAEEVGRSRSGFGVSSDTSTAYKDKLVTMARKTHLGEKSA